MNGEDEMRNFIPKITGWFLLCLLGWVCWIGWDIWSFSKQQQVLKVDAAIVLGAAVWDNQPSPVLRERIHHAIWLYENGFVRKVIFTGGKGGDDKHSESSIARQYAITKGIPDSDILTEEHSQITEENLKYTKEISEKNGLKSFLIVSDPLHMRRSTTMAHDLGMEAYSSPTSTSVYRSWETKRSFWIREVFYYAGYLITRPFRGNTSRILNIDVGKSISSSKVVLKEIDLACHSDIG